jgi:hypothetical protein
MLAGAAQALDTLVDDIASFADANYPTSGVQPIKQAASNPMAANLIWNLIQHRQSSDGGPPLHDYASHLVCRICVQPTLVFDVIRLKKSSGYQAFCRLVGLSFPHFSM